MCPRRIVLTCLFLFSCAGPEPTESDEAGLGESHGLRAELFAHADLTARRLVRVDAAVDFDWGQAAPAPNLPADQFSVRWSGEVVPRYSETYTISTVADDGVRLWVDGKLIIDRWTNHAPVEDSGTVALVAGKRYAVRLEYYDAGLGAVARLLWSSASQARQVIPSSQLFPAPASLRGEYYADPGLRALALTRSEPNVDFDWGDGAPDPSLPADGWSARFTGQLRPPAGGLYTFVTRADDGVRLWVDGHLVVDDWSDHAPRDKSGTVTLSAGHAVDLRLEYYERRFGAMLQLAWVPPGQARQVIPPEVLAPPREPSGPFGIDVRPSNAGCVAPPRPHGRTDVALGSPFPALTFSSPVALLQAPGDASRWFVVEKGGKVKVFANNASVSSASTFVDLGGRVNAGPQEGGLLGMAFDPGFATNHLVYLSYTAPSGSSPANLRSTVARFSSHDGGLTLDPTPAVLFEVDQPFENHNGGEIAFGPDGKLYLGLGDGGSAGDPGNRSQDPSLPFGKMLRIDAKTGQHDVFALGFRNPWRWSFDRATGELWVGDVGQNAWEEIDRVVQGGNYGWKVKEGTHCYGQNPCNRPDLIDPVYEYPHTDGISITGGFVYRGTALPALIGTYVYGDFGSGRIWGLFFDSTGKPAPAVLADSGLNLSSFGQGEDGELYVLDYYGGKIRKLVPGAGGPSTSFPKTLSATGCFASTAPLVPAAGVIPYDVRSPLWSDGADKQRWLALPDGAQVHIGADGDWELPIGAVLLKSFSVGGRRVETRMLVRHADGDWAGYSYEWNDAQTDAVLLEVGKDRDLGGQTWTFPSRAQCIECHTAAAGHTLGLETAQLNRDLVYPGGVSANQLATLDHIGLFDARLWQLPDELSRLPVPADAGPVADRARAYLHGNCSFCHRPGGTGRGPADFRFSTPFAAVGVCDAVPQTGDLGVAGARLLKPGDPSRSIISLRTHAPFGADRMPPLGSHLVDPVGTQVLDDWIRAVISCP